MRRALVILSLVGLAGCQPATSPPEATALAPAPIVKREGMNLADATVTLATLDGAPDAAKADFRAALVKAFAARGIVAADKGRYRLRIYLAARPEEGGASIDYVVDAYDASRVRLARLDDSFSVKGAGDPWSLMSSQTLDAVATACADNVAAFLSNAPEAKPAGL